MKNALIKHPGRMAVLSSIFAAFMSVSAFASNGETSGATSDVSTIVSAVSTIGQLLTSLFGIMTANPLLVVFLASSLLGVAISIFRRLKGASGGGG